MAFFLAHGVSYGRLPEATVVLDLRRDRYFRLGSRAAEALVELEGNGPFPESSLAGLGALIDAGLVNDLPGEPITPVTTQRPALSALEVPRMPKAGPGLARMSFANLRVRLSLARRGLGPTIERLRRGRAAARLHVENATAIAIAQNYARARRFIPGQPSCVSEAFTLSALLTRAGLAHDVFFGVSLTPFAAHAWAQCETHILSDRADPVRAFHPVFRL